MDDYFYLNEVFIKAAGMYIPPTSSKLPTKIFYGIYNTFWLTYCCVIFLPSEILAFDQFSSDITSLMKMFNMVMTHLLGSYKVALWFYYKKKITWIMETLNHYVRIYKPFGDFKPQEIMQKEKKIKNIFAVVYVTFGISVSLSGSAVGFKNLFLNVLEEPTRNNLTIIQNEEVNLSLSYFSLMPFDYKRTPVRFGFGLLYQLFPLYQYAWLIITFDSLYMALLSYVSVHFLIIQGAFRTLRERVFINLNIDVNREYLRYPKCIQNALDEEMSKITKHLQIIMEISEIIESAFNFIVLCQTMVSLIVLCTCLYLFSLAPAISLSAIKEAIYMIAVTLQTLLYAYFGNKVNISSESVSLGIYSMDWFGTTTSFKRSMIINIIRSQRGIYFTIGKFTKLTLSTFVYILRGSYSFFAVLRNS